MSDVVVDPLFARQVPGARMALAENAGGFLGQDFAAVVVTILST